MAQGKKGAVDQDIRINLRIGSALYEAGTALAERRGITFSQLIRTLITEAVVNDRKQETVEKKIKEFLDTV